MPRKEESARAKRAAIELAQRIEGKAPKVQITEVDDQPTPMEADPIPDPVTQDRKDQAKPDEETEEIALEEGTPKTVKIGSGMDVNERCNMIELLREHKDVFAFSAAEMPCVSPEIISHHLSVAPDKKPIQQKRRAFSEEKNKAIEEEV